MKKIKLTYWISTSLFSLIMVNAAYMYFTNPALVEAFKHIGMPDYFRVQLGIAKLLGAIALILPFVPPTLKRFSYAGFFIMIISAIIAHLVSGDEPSAWIPALFILGVVTISYLSHEKYQSIRVNTAVL